LPLSACPGCGAQVSITPENLETATSCPSCCCEFVPSTGEMIRSEKHRILPSGHGAKTSRSGEAEHGSTACEPSPGRSLGRSHARREDSQSPAQTIAVFALLCPTLVWIFQVLLALGFHNDGLVFNVPAVGLQSILILAGPILGIVALATSRPGGGAVKLPAVCGILLSGITILIVAIAIALHR